MTNPSSDMIADEEFHEWLTEAASNNLASITSDEFYRRRDTGDMLGLTVHFDDGESFRLPVYTHKNWITNVEDISQIIKVQDEHKTPVKNEEVLSRIAKQMAYRNGAKLQTAEITDHLWNGENYTVTGASTQSPSFKVTHSDFFSNLSTNWRLSYELYDELYQYGIDPDAEREALSDISNQLKLPFRNDTVPTLENVGVNQCNLYPLIAVTAIPIFKVDDEYHTILLKRGTTVATSPNQYSSVGGLFDPESNNLTEHIFREFIEELFDVEEGTSPRNHEIGKKLINSLNETIHIEYLATYLDSMIANYHLRFLLFIEDERITNRVLKDYKTNFEARSISFPRLSDIKKFKELSRENKISPPNEAAFFLALDRLSTEGKIANEGAVNTKWC